MYTGFTGRSQRAENDPFPPNTSLWVNKIKHINAKLASNVEL